MNKHIELVKKWLANPESVSQEELKANAEAAKFQASATYVAADAANAEAADAAHVAADAAKFQASATYYAADAANAEAADAAHVAYWVNRYEELTK